MGTVQVRLSIVFALESLTRGERCVRVMNTDSGALKGCAELEL